MNDAVPKHNIEFVESLKNYIAIARLDHWFKQVFCIPGVVLAVSIDKVPFDIQAFVSVMIGLLAASLTASSNYVLNEILDAPTDLAHPEKRFRPIPSGKVNIQLAYLEWLLLGAMGIGLSLLVNMPFFWITVWLWVMGIIYNVPPIRSKELVVGDVLSESINNPIRLLMGWYAVGAVRIAPLSLMCAYWLLGAFLMAAKRFAEYRYINDKQAARKYRRSFKHYTENRLVALMVFCVNCFSLFLGVFLIKYRVELILAVPFIAGFLAVYWHTSLRHNSPVQHPETLYRERRLMIACVTLTIVGTMLLLIDMPFIAQYFEVHIPSATG